MTTSRAPFPRGMRLSEIAARRERSLQRKYRHWVAERDRAIARLDDVLDELMQLDEPESEA